MKSLLASILAGLALLVVACGGDGSRSRPRVAGTSIGDTHIAPSTTLTARSVKGDEDDDDEGGPTSGKRDKDSDFDESKDRRKGQFDQDDRTILGFGHAASAADKRAITALVQRYYAAAGAGEAATVCSLLFSLLAEAIPESYGQEPGPAYLRGLKTCPAIVSRLLTRLHNEFTGPIQVSAVRIEEKRAYAVLGSPVRPAGYLVIHREAVTWKIDQLLASTLP